jgi:cobalt-zinc-cadmium resistance protein CzcA
MVARIFEFSLRQRVFVLLGVIGVVVAGVWSVLRLPIDAVPDITNVQVQINTSVAALAAEEIEKQITFPIETEMQGLKAGELRPSPASAFVTLVFGDHGYLPGTATRPERLQNVPVNCRPARSPSLHHPQGSGKCFHIVDYAPGARTSRRRVTSSCWNCGKSRMDQTPAPHRSGVTEVNTSGGYENKSSCCRTPTK